jgi:hypothetical protein
MKLSLNSIRQVIPAIALAAQLTLAVTPSIGGQHMALNKSGQRGDISTEMDRKTRMCIKEARRDYRRCISRGRHRASSCRRTRDETIRGCSG